MQRMKACSSCMMGRGPSCTSTSALVAAVAAAARIDQPSSLCVFRLSANNLKNSLSKKQRVLTTWPTAATPLFTQQMRGLITPDGKTYHPPYKAWAGAQVPLTKEMAEEFNKLGKMAHKNHNFRDALVMYDRVLQWRRDNLGSMHLQCASTLNNIGRVLMDMKDTISAETAFIEAAALYEKLEGEDSIKYADALGCLATCYYFNNAHPEAEKAFKETIAIYKKHCYDESRNSWIPQDRVIPDPPNESPLASVAHVLSDCATLYMYQRNTDDAIAFLDTALEIRRFLYSKNLKFKAIIAQTLTKLAELKRYTGDIHLAESYIDECTDICIETMGRDSPATAQAMSSKGNILSAKQRYREAKKYYEEALTTFAICFGKTHALVGSEYLHVGRMQEALQEMKEAEKSYDRALEIYTTAYGRDHIQTAEALNYVGVLQLKKLEYDKAIELLSEASRIRKKQNPDDPQLMFIYQRLGEAYAAKKDTEAEAYYMMAIELHRRESSNYETQALFLSDVLDDLGLHYLNFKLLDKAEECFRESLMLRDKYFTRVSKHMTIAYSLSSMALLYLQKENFEECLKYADESISMFEFQLQDLGDREMAFADVITTKAQAYFKMGKYNESLSHHHKALHIRRKNGDKAEVAVADTLLHMSKNEIELGEMEAAAEHLNESSAIANKFEKYTVDLRHDIELTRRAYKTKLESKQGKLS